MTAFVYDVHVEMLHPVRAKPGDRLVVRPGHHERPIVTMRYTDGDWNPMVVGPANFGALIGLAEDGAITQIHPAFVSLASLAQVSRLA